MSQDEDRSVIRRFVSPPAFPIVVGPWTTDWTEHVAPQNPGTDSLKALLCNFIVNSGLSVVITVHRSPHARLEKPFKQFRTIHAQRILEILIWSGTEAVD